MNADEYARFTRRTLADVDTRAVVRAVLDAAIGENEPIDADDLALRIDYALAEERHRRAVLAEEIIRQSEEMREEIRRRLEGDAS